MQRESPGPPSRRQRLDSAQPQHAQGMWDSAFGSSHSRLAGTQRHEHHPVCKSTGLARNALLPLTWGWEGEMHMQGHSSLVPPGLRLFLCNHLKVRRS